MFGLGLVLGGSRVGLGWVLPLEACHVELTNKEAGVGGGGEVGG